MNWFVGLYSLFYSKNLFFENFFFSIFQDPAVVDGLRCLVDGIPNLIDTYTTTQMAYALALASSPDLPAVMTKLEDAATNEGKIIII